MLARVLPFYHEVCCSGIFSISLLDYCACKKNKMKNTPILLLFINFLLLASCQKDIASGNNQPTTPLGTDSAWYISSFTRIGIDENFPATGEVDTSVNFYTYLPGKILHKYINKNRFGADSAQFSFYYDANGNLVKYQNDFNSDPLYDAQTVVFNYSGDKVTECLFTDTEGNTGKLAFTYSGNDKVITISDPLQLTEGALQYKYYFNDKNAVDSQMIVYNYGVPGAANDTAYTSFVYDSNGDITRIVRERQDTSWYTRDQRGGEVGATFKKILSNLFYFTLMQLVSNDALIFNDDVGQLFAHNAYHPVIIAKSRYNTSSVYTGDFINVFNVAGQLIKQTVPDRFGSKRGGPSHFEYSYIKVPK
jgi:hypothetical protein